MSEPAPFPQPTDDNSDAARQQHKLGWKRLLLIAVIALVVLCFVALHVAGLTPH